MFSAKPILVSLNGYRSIISEANCGKFIDSDNVGLLAESIEEFSNMDKMRLNEMGMNGKEYLINNLNHETLAKKYLDIIDSL